MNKIVLQWYYNDRDGKAIFPELSTAYGPFLDQETAQKWIEGQTNWGGWGRYEYEIVELVKPNE